jgi:hypothetical protein
MSWSSSNVATTKKLRHSVTCAGALQEHDYCNYNTLKRLEYVSTVKWLETAVRTMLVLYIHMLESVVTCWMPKRIVVRVMHQNCRTSWPTWLWCLSCASSASTSNVSTQPISTLTQYSQAYYNLFTLLFFICLHVHHIVSFWHFLFAYIKL